LIRKITSGDLSPELAQAVIRVCDAAYQTDTKPLFSQLGPGLHLLAFQGDKLVSHLMWVTRWLQPEGITPLRTAYVEMVATDPPMQRCGYASLLLGDFVRHVGEYELAALCPATESVYARLGWKFWRGPLAARREGHLIPTPEERVMLLPLPHTPALDWERPLSVEWREGEVW
jgi:GNAT superfamily N-acetyltransferase